jgi:DNA polymerase-3 subunit delta
MYKQHLDKLINSSTLPKALLLYGNCEYLSSEYTNKIANIFGPKEDRYKLFFDEYDFESAKGYLSQSSLFGNANILIVKTDKKIPKKELDTLIAICSKSTNSYFLLQFVLDNKDAKAMEKSFKKDFVRFFQPSSNEIFYIVKNKARELGLDIDDYAISTLVNLQNHNLLLIISELNKFLLLDQKITAKEVGELTYGASNLELEELITNLIENKSIKDDLFKIFEKASLDEIKILNTIQNYFSILFLFHTYIKINGNLDVTKVLGHPLPPQIIQKGHPKQ